MNVVKKSKNVSTVGLEGIVVQETDGTWTIVTKKNAVKGLCMRMRCFVLTPNFPTVVPKPGTIFTFALPLQGTNPEETRSLSFEISGSQFAHRSADRTTRKWKPRSTGDFGPGDDLL